MKFGGPLAIIVHYTVHFNLECCKCSLSNRDPNTFKKCFKITKNVLGPMFDTELLQHSKLNCTV